MDQEDADFLFGGSIVAKMRGEQIDKQQSTQQVTTGKNRNLQHRAFRLPENEEAAKEFVWA